MVGAFWTVLLLIVGLALIGGLYIWFLVRHCRARTFPTKSRRLMAVLGSGGHTTEMLELLRHFDVDKYPERTYVVAQTDTHSEEKMRVAEAALGPSGRFYIERIPRSREVGQSYLTSVFTTAHAIIYAFVIVYKHKPEVLVVNGPGTCIPICFAAAFFDLVRLTDTLIIYVESICRVQRLSLSAAILYFFGVADDVIVQWPELKDVYPRVKTIHELTEMMGKQE